MNELLRYELVDRKEVELPNYYLPPQNRFCGPQLHAISSRD
jgi:hypothetical protein